MTIEKELIEINAKQIELFLANIYAELDKISKIQVSNIPDFVKNSKMSTSLHYIKSEIEDWQRSYYFVREFQYYSKNNERANIPH